MNWSGAVTAEREYSFFHNASNASSSSISSISCNSYSLNDYIVDSTGTYLYPDDFINYSTQIGNTILGTSSNDNSGKVIDLSKDGNIVAIGSPFDDDFLFNSGSVKVFEYSGQDWLQKGSSIHGSSEDEEFGSSIALSYDGQVLAIGSMNSDLNGTNSGEVRVYLWNNNDYVLMGSIIGGDNENQKFGS